MLLEKLGLGAFFVFAFFSLCALFLASWLPETKNVPLEEIESLDMLLEDFDSQVLVRGEARSKPLSHCVGQRGSL